MFSDKEFIGRVPYHVGVFAGVILMVGTHLPAAERPVDYSPVIDQLKTFIRDEVAAKDLPATSIALVTGDHLVWSAGFGSENRSNNNPASASTVYRVGSVSKLFNALAVMRLVGEGKLDLDEDVRTYLTEFAPANTFGTAITLRFLLSHQSGVVREPPIGSYFDATSPSLAETVASLNDTRIVFEPGTQTKYSNAAVSVAGLAVERVAGEPYNDYLQRAVLDPLKMKASAFRPTAAIEEHLPEAWMWAHHYGRFPAPAFEMGILPAGNLYSTVTDLSQLLITMFQESPPTELGIDRDVLLSMVQFDSPEHQPGHDYGIGFRLGDLDGHPSFEHGGAVYGYATLLKGIPEEKVGVVVAIALDGANGVANRIGDYALRLMLAQKSGHPLPKYETSQSLALGQADRLAGRYRCGEQSIVVVGKGSKAFVMYRNSLGEIRREGENLVIDDVLRHGPALQWNETAGTIKLDGQIWSRHNTQDSPEKSRAYPDLVGEYGWDHNVLYVYEDHGKLRALIEWFYDYPMTELGNDRFGFPDSGLYKDEQIVFVRDASGDVTQAIAGGVRFPRRPTTAVDPSEAPSGELRPQVLDTE
ncbi:serine hydrolase domain-containing protein [Botrimarina mediterranea]|uniref:D-alanyl-D-alanine carboxypeptidase n=1 Tax=Botrimarina mediterranea TaxID=2528022 RepID=A0A518K7R1_9BACT|nr:serine hydrolase domain-containing protein [Botrimarina mediterranea]QDV73820.1 D-alanyl-D-alanine carboxypeptidase precursor [Botrimarina mediterranea]QDV78449.1 D-alanyl-D-alanine carboxypeptidase precursor [Planctomycetes bacterium K2D]